MKYHEISDNLSGKTAFVYSQSDESHYTIKLIDKNKQQEYFVKDVLGKTKLFDSIESVKKQLKKLRVDASYIALDNTYDEFGHESIEELHHDHKIRHDYMPLCIDE